MAERQSFAGQTVLTAPVRATQDTPTRDAPRGIAGGLADLGHGMASLSQSLYERQQRDARASAMQAEESQRIANRDAQLAATAAAIQIRDGVANKYNLDSTLPDQMGKVVTDAQAEYSTQLKGIQKLYPNAQLSGEWANLEFLTKVGSPLMDKANATQSKLQVEHRYANTTRTVEDSLTAMPVITDAKSAAGAIGIADDVINAAKNFRDTEYDPKYTQSIIDKARTAYTKTLKASASVATASTKDAILAAATEARKRGYTDPQQHTEILKELERSVKVNMDPNGPATKEAVKTLKSQLETPGGSPDERAQGSGLLHDLVLAQGTSDKGVTTPEWQAKAVRESIMPSVIALSNAKVSDIPSASVLAANSLETAQETSNIYSAAAAIDRLFPAGNDSETKTNFLSYLTQTHVIDTPEKAAAFDAMPVSDIREQFVSRVREMAQQRLDTVKAGQSYLLVERDPSVKALSQSGASPAIMLAAYEQTAAKMGIPERDRVSVPSIEMTKLTQAVEQKNPQDIQRWHASIMQSYGPHALRFINSLRNVKSADGKKEAFSEDMLAAFATASYPVLAPADNPKQQQENTSASNELLFTLMDASNHAAQIDKAYPSESNPDRAEIRLLIDKGNKDKLDRYTAAGIQDPFAPQLLGSNMRKQVLMLANNFRFGATPTSSNAEAVNKAFTVLANSFIPVRTGSIGTNTYSLKYIGDSEKQRFIEFARPGAFDSPDDFAEYYSATLDSIKYNGPEPKLMDANPAFVLWRSYPDSPGGRFWNKNPTVYGEASDLITQKVVGQSNGIHPSQAKFPGAFHANAGFPDSGQVFTPVGTMNIDFAGAQIKGSDGKYISMESLYDPAKSTLDPEQYGLRASAMFMGKEGAPLDIRVKAALGEGLSYRYSPENKGYEAVVRAKPVGNGLPGKVSDADGLVRLYNKDGTPIIVKDRDISQSLWSAKSFLTFLHY